MLKDVMQFFINLPKTWWGITAISIVCILVWLLFSALFYKVFFKRFYDIVLSGIAIIVLSPIYVVVAILVRLKLGRPVIFSQLRPLKKSKIKTIHKFRTMTDDKDENGVLLTDEIRLTKFGKLLRSTSLDELPQLFDIFGGRLSIVGPRPLLVQYLPLYNESQARRHDVRPGLTGLAQVNGRNAITWEQKFEFDIFYVDNLCLFTDIAIIFKTVKKVFKRSDIAQSGHSTMEDFVGTKEEE